MASASSRKGITVRNGPNTSSCATRIFESALVTSVVEYDHRVLAAKLEMHALQRVGALRHDRRARRALADKADRLDGGMFGQCLAGFLAEPVHGVEHAVGQTGLPGKLRQEI